MCVQRVTLCESYMVPVIFLRCHKVKEIAIKAMERPQFEAVAKPTTVFTLAVSTLRGDTAKDENRSKSLKALTAIATAAQEGCRVQIEICGMSELG